MKKIEHFILPKQYNDLYTKEAISSISLTRDVADKINELIDMYNNLSEEDLTWKHEIEGTIRKAIIYIKDHLLNTLYDMSETYEKDGFFEQYVKKYITDLENRLNTVLSSQIEDGELLDARYGADGYIHSSLGESIRNQVSALISMIENGGHILNVNDFQNNWYYEDWKHPNKTQIRIGIKEPIYLKEGETIHVIPKTLYCGLQYADDLYGTNSVAYDWVNTEFTFTAPKDCYVVVGCATSSIYEESENLTPNDYDATIYIIKGLPSVYLSYANKKFNFDMMLPNNDFVTFGDYNIFLPGEKLYIMLNGKRIEHSYHSIMEDLGSDVATITEEGMTITFNNDISWLGYDLKNNKFVIGKGYGTSDPQYYKLVINYYNNLSGFLIIKYMLHSKIDGDTFNDLVYSSKNFVYTSSNAPITWTKNTSNGKVVVSFANKIVVRTQFKAEAIEWDAEHSIHTYTFDGNKADITIRPYYSLVYDIVDHKLKEVVYNNLNKNHLVLLQNSYGYLVGGYLLPIINRQQIENATSDIESLSMSTKPYPDQIKNYNGLFNNSGEVESFIFFTDSHLCQTKDWQSKFNEYMNTIKYYYDNTPTNFVLDGGDWLGNSDTQADACFKLGVVRGTLDNLIPSNYSMIGNHDTNYQGVIDENDTGSWTGQLSQQTINNLWFKGQKAYYKFTGSNTDFYIFDTGIENESMGEYQYAQCKWFASELLKNTSKNIALGLHIVHYNDNKIVEPISNQILLIAKAFNNKTSIVVNGESFDFSSVSGKIRYCLTGHRHKDYIETINSIPVIFTANLQNGDTPTFDLILADYTNNKLMLHRIGTGENREVSI